MRWRRGFEDHRHDAALVLLAAIFVGLNNLGQVDVRDDVPGNEDERVRPDHTLHDDTQHKKMRKGGEKDEKHW